MSKPKETGSALATRRKSSFGSEAGLADLIQHFLLAQDIKPSSKNLLGHASAQLTLDRYSHLMPQTGQAAATRLDHTVFG